MIGTDLLRAVHPKHNFVGEPVGADVHDRGEKEAGDEPLTAAEHAADTHEQRAHQAKKKRRFDRIGHK